MRPPHLAARSRAETDHSPCPVAPLQLWLIDREDRSRSLPMYRSDAESSTHHPLPPTNVCTVSVALSRPGVSTSGRDAGVAECPSARTNTRGRTPLPVTVHVHV